MKERKYATSDPELIEKLRRAFVTGEPVEINTIGLPFGKYLVRSMEKNSADPFHSITLEQCESSSGHKRKYYTWRTTGKESAPMLLALRNAQPVHFLASGEMPAGWYEAISAVQSPSGEIFTLRPVAAPPVPVAPPPPPATEPTLSDLLRELQGVRCEVVELRAKVDGLRRELLAHGAPLRMEVAQ